LTFLKEPELHPHDNCARVNPEDRLKGPAQQGKPLTQTKTNENQQGIFSSFKTFDTS